MRSTDIPQLVLLGIAWGIVALGSGSADACLFGYGCDYPCHCRYNATCDDIDGSCPDGCDDGHIGNDTDLWHAGGWYGYGCQIGNVAYEKPTGNGPNSVWPAYRAVDGNHTVSSLANGCAASRAPSDGDVGAWWQVDLADNYVILSVAVTSGWELNRAVSTRVEVGMGPESNGDDFILCYLIENYNGLTEHRGQCSRPLIGRYVRLRRSVGSFEYWNLFICEVHVYGYLYYACPSDYFGVACGTPCNCRSTCDDVTGHCPDENCKAGWKGNDCQASCSFGLWGAGCQQQCGCIDGDACDVLTGHCPDGCVPGFGGSACQLPLPYLSSIIHVNDITSNSLQLNFAAWSDNTGAGSMPYGYTVQWRVDGNPTWNNALVIRHAETERQLSTRILGLQHATAYLMRVVPFIIDGGDQYDGRPSREFGLYKTAMDSPPSNCNPATAPSIIAVVSSSVVIMIMLVISFILLRRQLVELRKYMKKRLPERPLDFYLDPVRNACHRNSGHHPRESSESNLGYYPYNSEDHYMGVI